MLHLKSVSETRWLEQVRTSLDEVLIDHAHCEHKAAATAMSLFGNYIEHHCLTIAMSEIVEEELEHFHMVLKILESRGIAFVRQKPGHYGKELNALVRPNEPDRAVDRLLIAGLIEARSCERFRLLSEFIVETEPELAEFYASLFESEARHHTTYIKCAKLFADDATVRTRLDELAELEAQIVGKGNQLPRMHS